MQYLVMKNRILYLPHMAIYDIYKPMAHLKDQRCSVTASEPEDKRSYTLFRGSLEECQRFLAAFAKVLNTAENPAVSIEDVLQAMQPSTDENTDERISS